MSELRYQHKYQYKIVYINGKSHKADVEIFRDTRGIFDIDIDEILNEIKKDVGTTRKENSSVKEFEFKLCFDQPKAVSHSK